MMRYSVASERKTESETHCEKDRSTYGTIEFSVGVVKTPFLFVCLSQPQHTCWG